MASMGQCQFVFVCTHIGLQCCICQPVPGCSVRVGTYAQFGLEHTYQAHHAHPWPCIMQLLQECILCGSATGPNAKQPLLRLSLTG